MVAILVTEHLRGCAPLITGTTSLDVVQHGDTIVSSIEDDVEF